MLWLSPYYSPLYQVHNLTSYRKWNWQRSPKVNHCLGKWNKMLHYSQMLVVPPGLEAFCRQRSVSQNWNVIQVKGQDIFHRHLKFQTFKWPLQLNHCMLQQCGFWGSFSSKCWFKGHGVSSGWFVCWPVLLLVELHEKISLYLGKKKRTKISTALHAIQYTTSWVLSSRQPYFITLMQDFSFCSLLSKTQN